jgi:hypothetical protein
LESQELHNDGHRATEDGKYSVHFLRCSFLSNHDIWTFGNCRTRNFRVFEPF